MGARRLSLASRSHPCAALTSGEGGESDPWKQRRPDSRSHGLPGTLLTTSWTVSHFNFARLSEVDSIISLHCRLKNEV